MGNALCLLALLWLSGCATLGLTGSALVQADIAAVQICRDWYHALDSAVTQADVRDAAAQPVPGFVQLRADRFHAALGQDANTSADRPTYRLAWMQSLQQLDLQARGFEIQNLSSSQRKQLAVQAGLMDATGTPQALLDHTHACAARLTQQDAQSPERMAQLEQRVQVPDSYRTAYRVLGFYALTRYPFAAGVRRFEAQQQAVFDAAAPAHVDSHTPTAAFEQSVRHLQLLPPQASSSPTLTAQSLRPNQIAQMLAPAAQDPLRKPQPTPQELERLFAHHAPSFDLAIASDEDEPGALYWSADPAQPLAQDTRSPVLYRQVAYTRYQGHNLLQLVYTLWFGARPRQADTLVDLLAGHLDGVVWRVTLAPDGSPLIYDSMHPCGCYHFFFPTPSVRPKPAPQSGIEWAFSPQTVPDLQPHQRLVLRVAATTHYLQHIGVEPKSAGAVAQRSPGEAVHYSWRDYDSLRSLPLAHSSQGSQGESGVDKRSAFGQERRSAFGPEGFIAGTDRLESWLFWPMGIARAGAMRQWGHHATAFVGRRHFDDAHLLEQRFEFDPRHFLTQTHTAPSD